MSEKPKPKELKFDLKEIRKEQKRHLKERTTKVSKSVLP
jgi:hypothetical protein